MKLDITRLQEEIKSGEESLTKYPMNGLRSMPNWVHRLKKRAELKGQISKILEQRNSIDKEIKDIRIKISTLETGSIKMKAQIDEKMNRRSVIEKSITDLSISIVDLEKKAQVSRGRIGCIGKQAKSDLEEKITSIEENLFQQK